MWVRPTKLLYNYDKEGSQVDQPIMIRFRDFFGGKFQIMIKYRSNRLRDLTTIRTAKETINIHHTDRHPETFKLDKYTSNRRSYI